MSTKKMILFKSIPNILTITRIILSLLLILMVLNEFKLITIVVLFAIAALTDGLDGFIARRYKLVTDFGRRWDIIADRILMISIIITMIYYMISNNLLTSSMLIQLLLILSREIVAAPFFIGALLFKKTPLPHAKLIGKTTTLFQGVAFPMIILGWNISIFFAIVTCVIGIISGIVYAKDSYFSS